MHHTLLLSKYKSTTRYALLNKEGVPLEFGLDYFTYRNAIYMARISAISPSFGMVFFDLGPTFKHPGLFSTTPTHTKQFEVGQHVLVQIRFASPPLSYTRSVLPLKGPTVSPELRFSSPYFIYFPQAYTPGVFYSKRVSKHKIEPHYSSLRSILSSQEGLILRPLSEVVSLSVLHDHLEKTKIRVSELLQKKAKIGTCIYSPPSVLFQKLEDIAYTLSKIIMDDKTLFGKIEKFIEIYNLSCTADFKIPNPLQDSLFKAFSLEEQWEESISPLIPLPSGGNLFIEKTEGFWVVDVNSQGREGVSSALTPQSLNEEAAKVLFSILRLCNMSGKILVDFLPFSQKKDYQKFHMLLERLSNADVVSTKVSWLNQKGLCEITRERTSLSLIEAMKLF